MRSGGCDTPADLFRKLEGLACGERGGHCHCLPTGSIHHGRTLLDFGDRH